MNSRQIECFLKAAEKLNFSKAAEELFLPQPAVSRYITALEKELGEDLFIRESNRKVVLSEYGKVCYNLFHRFTVEFAQIQNTRKKQIPPLRLGYSMGWNVSHFLPLIINNCRQKYPDFEINFECVEMTELPQMVREDKLDVVIMIENHPGINDLMSEHITATQRLLCYSDRLFDNYGIEDHSLERIEDFYPFRFYLLDDQNQQKVMKDTERLF